jgi:hypothetical protein
MEKHKLRQVEPSLEKSGKTQASKPITSAAKCKITDDEIMRAAEIIMSEDFETLRALAK